MAAFLDGDRNAGEQLLMEVLPRIRNVIRVLVGRDRDIDDIAQIVMVNVIGSLASYRAEAPLAAWVDRITARTTLAYIRRRRAKEHVESDFEEERPSVASLGDRHVEAAEGVVDVRKVLGYLDVLPDVQRQAVVLHHALGYTIAEAAEQQSVSSETLRSRLRLGLARVREHCAGKPSASNGGQAQLDWSSIRSEGAGLPEASDQELP